MKSFRSILDEAKVSGTTNDVPADKVPAHVKKVVKAVHKTLKKHGITGARVSVQHHDYVPRHDKADGGHHEVSVELGEKHVRNETAVSELVGHNKKAGGTWAPARKKDVIVAPSASMYPAPKHPLHEQEQENDFGLN